MWKDYDSSDGFYKDYAKEDVFQSIPDEFMEWSVRGKGDQEVQENCTRGHRGGGVEIFGGEAGRVGQEAAVEEAQEVGQHMKHIVHEFESDY